MIRILFAFAVCWIAITLVIVSFRSPTPDEEWNLTIRNGYWWREYNGKNARIETLGKFERITAYKLGEVSIQTTSGDYRVRYDGRTGDIDGVFYASGEEITERYTTAPNRSFSLSLHVIGTIMGLIGVYSFVYSRCRQ